MTLDALLVQACRGQALSRLEARLLLAHACNRPQEWVIAHGLEAAEPDTAHAFLALAARRAAGEPIAYLLGSREFFSRSFMVTPAVLIPRPETELLVEVGLELIRDRVAPRVLDLGTGSGVLAVTLALERPDAVVIASDASAPALAQEAPAADPAGIPTEGDRRPAAGAILTPVIPRKSIRGRLCR